MKVNVAVEIIKVNGIDLSIKEWRGQKVLTAGDINRVLRKSKASSWVGRLRDRCKAAGYPLEENKDYFKGSKEEAKEAFQLKAVCEEITLYTASGYTKLLHQFQGKRAEIAAVHSLAKEYFGVNIVDYYADLLKNDKENEMKAKEMGKTFDENTEEFVGNLIVSDSNFYDVELPESDTTDEDSELSSSNHLDLQVIEYEDQRVLTTAQLAASYETTERRISENFNANKGRYIEGEHYYCLTGDELKKLENSEYGFSVVAVNTNKIYLWTERGALFHAKSLGTDKAWEVYDNLVEFYFRDRNQIAVQQLPAPDTSMEQQIRLRELELRIKQEETRQAEIAQAERERVYNHFVEMSRAVNSPEQNDTLILMAATYLTVIDMTQNAFQAILNKTSSAQNALHMIHSMIFEPDEEAAILPPTADEQEGFAADAGIQDRKKLYSATEIGKMLGISKTMVGTIANDNDLKTPEYGIYDKILTKGGIKDTFRYNQSGVDAIAKLYQERCSKPKEKKSAKAAKEKKKSSEQIANESLWKRKKSDL